MKLYLSSYRIPTPQDFVGLIGKTPSETKIALIPNAKDYYAERARNFKNNVVLEFMQSIGFKPELIDLRDYSDAVQLKAKLRSFDTVWVAGGNTFNLRYEMKRSGLEKILKGLLENGLVYGGDSAGAIVVGPTLKGTEMADEPEFAEEAIFEGLNITNKLIIPHADNLEFGDAIKKMIEMYKDHPNAVVLNDNQAFIIDGDQTKIVTAS
jgi:dipeptidase E